MLFQKNFPPLVIEAPSSAELQENEELKKIQLLHETVSGLKKIIDDFPSDKIFPADDFLDRKEPNNAWDFGTTNQLLAVYAFRTSKRSVPLVESRMKDLYHGVDLLVDARTTREKDVCLAVKNRSHADALEKSVQTLENSEIKKICFWEPVQFEILQAGASTCLQRNTTNFTIVLLEMYEEQLKPYGEAFTILDGARSDINTFGNELHKLRLTPTEFGEKKFEELKIDDILNFAQELNLEVTGNSLIVFLSSIFRFIPSFYSLHRKRSMKII